MPNDTTSHLTVRVAVLLWQDGDAMRATVCGADTLSSHPEEDVRAMLRETDAPEGQIAWCTMTVEIPPPVIRWEG